MATMIERVGWQESQKSHDWHPNMHTVLNYALGCASVVLLILAFSPGFARFKKQIRYTTIFVVGMFAGSVCASLIEPVTVVQLHFGLSPILLLAAGVVVVIVVVLILWIAAG